jgi:hypothetical protein
MAGADFDVFDLDGGFLAMEFERGELVGARGLGDFADAFERAEGGLDMVALILGEGGRDADGGAILAGQDEGFDALATQNVAYGIHLRLGCAELHDDDHLRLKVTCRQSACRIAG